ncbi:class I SAM-dependent methyltransferase [Fortiea sp. LEGE XX443]|uniref:class I SAM-dependent methyltransferase n=1 Tax=Fortiea sp. LEGE XX443 TaxID=1828611 RepID=UPI001882852A|nr:class I SAM-dependent methyltransferase [Fortiea sp. LEGE XX443]MBE9007768.1 class I SAM-dependent methyltransferase [Fortiea sp. LEGE XX443]
MTTTISFDRVSDIYDATRGLPTGVSEQVTDFILNLISPTAETKFFETGIGTGRIAIPIAKKGYSYTGVDISHKMLSELHQKLEGISHQLTTVKADATFLPFADNSFDVALTVHVFHLISAWKQALAEIRRVLKPGGIYLYSHGNMNSIRVNEDVNQDRFEFHKRWKAILASYGYVLPRYGAKEDEVLAELHQQGATLETVIAATWCIEMSVDKLLQHHESKIYSSAWNIPDDIFTCAIQDLREWCLQRYNSLDYNFSEERKFKFVIVRNWA